jgi:5-methylcytosine-specific restriction protein B
MQNNSATFDWIPFYEELAPKLLSFRNNQGELLSFLEELISQGLTITPLLDRDDSGNRFPLQEIDPFTFYGVFNRQTRWDNRIRILEAIKTKFGLLAPVPTAFDAIPVLNNQRSWLFAYSYARDPGDIGRLWDVFSEALEPDPMNNRRFADSFDRALKVRNTNINLTMGLFWVRSSEFISLDSPMCSYLDIVRPTSGITFNFYQQEIERIKERYQSSFPEISMNAWQDGREQNSDIKNIGDGVDYWLVGAFWDGTDQTSRFLEEGIWENGYTDRYLDLVREMKVGDRIAIKAVSTRRIDLPFDNRGATVSKLNIKAIGTIVANREDGRNIEVDWQQPWDVLEWYFYTFRPTVWRLRKDSDMAQELIRFAFFGEPQDYDRYIDRWWGDGEGKGDGDGDEETPYTIEDVRREGVFLSDKEVDVAVQTLRMKKNLILQGPPGVGKTFIAKKLAYALMESRDDSRITTVQLHPSYTYEDFVRGYRPTDEAGRFSLTDGPFTRLCQSADENPDRDYVLIIDEINRGNLSQIFGEAFSLLEPDKRGLTNAITPLYRRFDGDVFFVPSNVYVIGTMNIADRSLALVDYALRRRFAFLTLDPKFGDPVYRSWLLERNMPEGVVDAVIRSMTRLNRVISEERQLGRSYQIGHSFFCPRGNDFSELNMDWFRRVVTTEIQPLVEEYWFDEPNKAENLIIDVFGVA